MKNLYDDLNNWYQEPLKHQDGKSPDKTPVIKKQSRKGGSRYQKSDNQSRYIEEEDLQPKKLILHKKTSRQRERKKREGWSLLPWYQSSNKSLIVYSILSYLIYSFI